MKTVELTSNNFDAIFEGAKPLIIDFWAEWCGPCKMMTPVMEQLADENDGVIVASLDVDSNPDIAKKFNVRSIPTILFFKNGVTVDKQVGAVPKSVLAEKLKRLLK